MKTSDSFDRYDLSFTDHLSCIYNCISSSFFSADQIDFWSAFITAHRLCIKTSGFLVCVFLCALWAHRKFFHTCTFSVIWQCIQNRKPWTATGAVDKWMQISSVFWIKQLFFTFITDCDIWGNKDFSFCFFTLNDIKCFKMQFVLFRNVFYIYFQNSCSFWWIFF